MDYPEFEESAPYCTSKWSEPSEMDLPERYRWLTSEQKEILRKWIDANIVPARRVPTSAKAPKTSYSLKERFEKSPEGFYVTNGAFKAAMLEAGFKPVDAKAMNWRFRAKYIAPELCELEKCHAG